MFTADHRPDSISTEKDPPPQLQKKTHATLELLQLTMVRTTNNTFNMLVVMGHCNHLMQSTAPHSDVAKRKSGTWTRQSFFVFVLNLRYSKGCLLNACTLQRYQTSKELFVLMLRPFYNKKKLKRYVSQFTLIW